MEDEDEKPVQQSSRDLVCCLIPATGVSRTLLLCPLFELFLRDDLNLKQHLGVALAAVLSTVSLIGVSGIRRLRPDHVLLAWYGVLLQAEVRDVKCVEPVRRPDLEPTCN